MIASLLTLLGSSAVGSFIGGVFAILNRKADNVAKGLELEHEVKRWSHDATMLDKQLEYARLEAESKKEVAVVEANATMESARFAAIGQIASAAEKLDAGELQAAGRFKWLLVLATALTKLIRPLVTLTVTSAALFLNGLILTHFVDSWEQINSTQRLDLVLQALAWICGQGSVIISYWFVSRGSGR